MRAATCLFLAVVTLAASQLSPSTLLTPEHPVFREPAPARFHVRLETSKGLVLLDVERRLSPQGVDRFYQLVRHGYYDNARFFRVVRPRFAQFGIAADPAVAQTWRTRTMRDEPRLASNHRGAVSYAFAVPHGRTTQIFINLQNNAETFDAEPFVPFAHVIDGMPVVDQLFHEYGEASGGGIRAGKQEPLFVEGVAFLLRQFPQLDYIVRAVVAPL